MSVVEKREISSVCKIMLRKLEVQWQSHAAMTGDSDDTPPSTVPHWKKETHFQISLELPIVPVTVIHHLPVGS